MSKALEPRTLLKDTVMSANDSRDPILRKTEPNDNKPEKRRAAKFVITTMVIIGVVVFVVYATMIGFSATGG